MNTHLRAAVLVLLVLPTWLLACTTSAQESPPPELSGQWSGAGRVVVDWVRRRELDVELSFAEDGAVSGRVGDARLVDGRLRSNRGALGRRLGWWTDWIVEGQLEGELLADEGFVATRTTLPFDLVDGRVDGGLHAWGSFADGRRGGRLSVARLHMQRR